MRLDRLLVLVAVFACVAISQQPNIAGQSVMTIDQVDGPPYPIQTNVRTSTQPVFRIAGLTNANFVIVRSANGDVQPGAASYFGDSYDLPLSPPFVVCLDGVANPAFATDLTGQFVFAVNVPPPGNAPAGIPLGFNAAYQAAIVDYFSTAYGWSLTAATRCTIVQGPTVVNMNTGIGTYGDSGQATVNLGTFGLTLPFYGNNHTTVHISGDGFMTFGGSQVPDYTPTNTEMNSGPPRIAGFWCDMDQQAGAIVRYTIDANPPGGTPFVKVEFINVMDAVTGYLHTISWKIDSTGYLEIDQSSSNNPSIYDTIVGIGAGNNLYTPPNNKNLSAMISPFTYQGAVNESFYEWFGIVTLNPYYTLGVDDPYDLFARTLHFLPTGSGNLPGSTNRYVLY